MQTTPSFQSRTTHAEAIDSARMMRSHRASGAQGFAQIMQAFDPAREDSIAKQVSDSQQSGLNDSDADQKLNAESITETLNAASEESSPVEDQAVEQSTSDDGESSLSNTAGTLGTDQIHTQQVEQAQIDVQSAINPTNAEGTQGNDAALRSLENQSQHAKLSIKSSSDAQLHASLGDVTTNAVQTRLSEDPSTQTPAQIQLAQAQSAPLESAQSTPVEPKNAIKNDAPAVYSQSPNTSGDVLDLSQSGLHNTGQNHRQNAQSAFSQANTDDADETVRQNQSTRTGTTASANLAAAAAGSLSSTGTTPSQSSQHVQVQSSSSAQPIQAVAGASAGNIGSTLSDSNAGSLVEKLKSPEPTDQTKQAAILTQVQRGMASLLRSGKGEMTLKLTPGHLGEIKIRLKSDGNRLGVRFETSSKETSELLSKGLKELTSILKAKGIHLDQIQMEHRPSTDTSDHTTTDADARSGFNDSGAHPDQSKHASDQQSRHASRPDGSDLWGDEQLEDNQAQSLWTELGLDAIA